MLKVIYFDESSALDSLDQNNKGRIEKITKEMIDKANELSGKVEGQAKASTGLLSFFKLGFGVDAKGQYSRKGSNILTTTLTNTILTGFIDIMEKNEEKRFVILQDYKLKIVPDSFTFIKTMTPFIKVYSSQISAVGQSEQEGQTDSFNPQNIDFSLLDEVLLNAKGYYELLAVKGNERKIVRFNLDGLRNNYKLTDLQKMNLTLCGIKVGSCTEESLHFANEIGNDMHTEGDTGFNAFEDDQARSNGELEIIDIILAGIK